MKHCVENYHVDIVNDVSGLQNIEILDFVVNSNRKIVLMHNLGIPNYSNNIVDYEKNAVDIIIEWFEKKIDEVLNYKGGGIDKNQIILDPGIGFGKSAYHCWQIVKEIKRIKKHFNLPILFGHSKKVFLKTVTEHSYTVRVNQTVGASIFVADMSDYLRVHDVKLHAEALSAWFFGDGFVG
jgi:2-amino-4-hydroxy-6-hydroxymethyldihydropteridine diphosphokinase/dihydropteroate synthase